MDREAAAAATERGQRTCLGLIFLERVAMHQRQPASPSVVAKRSMESITEVYGGARQVHDAVLPQHWLGVLLTAVVAARVSLSGSCVVRTLMRSSIGILLSVHRSMCRAGWVTAMLRLWLLVCIAAGILLWLCRALHLPTGGSSRLRLCSLFAASQRACRDGANESPAFDAEALHSC